MTEVIETAAAMRAWAGARVTRGERIVLVPTMGALHAGHLSLVAAAREYGDAVVVSIFVNPIQFGAGEDLARYPKDLTADLAALAGVDGGVDAVFAPAAEAVYRPGFATYVVPEDLASTLCGASRPGHFRGVCTVVLLLLRISRCHAALFGEKDYQQLKILQRMSDDLWLDVEVIGMPTVREADGLAMSSRNAYLSATERHHALRLYRALCAMSEQAAAGERRVPTLVAAAREMIANDGAVRIDYLSVVDGQTLQPIERIGSTGARAAVAAYVGNTRLIDNRALGVNR